MWLYLIVGVLLLFLITPVLIIIPMAFSTSPFFVFPPPGVSAKWFNQFFGDSLWVESLTRSLEVAMLSTLVATILGILGALAVSRLSFKGKNLFMAVMLSPMLVPVIVVAIAVYRFFSEIHLVGSIPGLVLAHALLGLPVVFVTVLASLKGIDRNLELAAEGLGSTPVGVFFRITLPLIKPGILSGALFAFITSMDEVVVTIFISGVATPTLPRVMWEQMRAQVDPTMAAASTLIIAATTILFLVQWWFTNRQEAKNRLQLENQQ
ncbi:ABC transporter permease [Effusibacillus lacus]|uniref:Polyamine ABC transporter permease n=1 Tax=Effusibacillus lacus TaxID=1348429 RepID=A0A292YJP6_9BACL|nr:ABC transporter permease [Effusibacillus lacus]TCS75518.1 putative spermidine/putrescine transport system permease protein [Effusibacillus lacus]GAX88983.1 polyamine ABC transporter permease [Effusibacillus lacus]